MEATDHGDQGPANNDICSLEWIVWAVNAARRTRKAEPADQNLDVSADRESDGLVSVHAAE